MRIRILCIAVLLAMVSCGSSAGKYPGKGNEQAEDLTYAPSNVVKVLDRQQKAAFDFFFGGTDPQTGMIYEGTERGQCITTGGAGFGIMALCVGVERGWITREQGLERIGRIVSFLTDCERYHGAWSHWNNPDGTYMAFGKQKATGDLVETSFVMQGLLAASEYFDKDNESESLLREHIENLYDSVEWSFYTDGASKGIYGIPRQTPTSL